LRTPWWLIVVALAAAVYLPGVDRPLRDSEAKYAEIPREMVELGEWLTPYLDYATYYEKPPLSYWPTALLYAGFGVSEAAARLANLAWAFASAALLALLGAMLFDRRTSFLAFVLFLLTTEVYVYGLDAGIEFALVAPTIAAVAGYWRFHQTGALRWLAAFYAAMGLGFLAKGLPGVFVPGGAAFVHGLWCRDGHSLRRLFHPLGPAVFLAVVGPWLVAMALRHPDFLEVFFLNEHLRRFSGSMVSNDALFPTGLWLALVAAELFPWILHLPVAAGDLARGVRAHLLAADRLVLLGAWAAIPLVTYSLSRSKVDAYGLQVYPPLLLAMAVPLADMLGERRFASSRAWALPWFLVTGLAIGSLAVLGLGRDSAFVAGLGIPSLELAIVFLAVTGLFGLGAALAFAVGRAGLALACIAVVCVVLFQVTRSTYEVQFPEESRKFAADRFNELARADAILVSAEPPEFEHVAVLAFYTRQRVPVLAASEGTRMTFLQRERQALILNEPELLDLAADRRDVFLVGEPALLEGRLERLGLRTETLDAAGGRVLYRLVPQEP
jgi:4-amino-4-deoxy-L-arabinose transferase-like glycosyltransferase